MTDIETAEPSLALADTPLTVEQPVALRVEAVPQAIQETPIRVDQSMDDFIAMALRDPTIDVGKLEALLRMKREVVAEQAKIAFYEALHAVQAEMPQVEKLGSVNLIAKDGRDLGSYAFTKWEDMDKVLRPIYIRHGFTLDFDQEQRQAEGGGAKVIAHLSRGGHTITRSISLALDSGAGRNNLQAMGSTISYAKRYLAEMLFNIVRKGQDRDAADADKKFITEEQEAEIIALMKEAGREQATFLPRMCTDVRSAAEIDSRDFIRVKGALQEIISMRKSKGAPNAANG